MLFKRKDKEMKKKEKVRIDTIKVGSLIESMGFFCFISRKEGDYFIVENLAMKEERPYAGCIMVTLIAEPSEGPSFLRGMAEGLEIRIKKGI
jgi:hypothetical protein